MAELTRREQRIMSHLKTHLEDCVKKYPDHEWVGIFLCGSQNYQLDTFGSDIDSKFIVLPTLEDIALMREPISEKLSIPGGEFAEVKDIRLMFGCYRKQNVNFVETLFTQFRIVNPDWADLFQPMLDNNEKIARYNKTQAIHTMCGMIRERYKRFEIQYGTGQHDSSVCDHKAASHIVRIAEFIGRYIAGEPYADCLIPRDKGLLMDYKSRQLAPAYVAEQAKAAKLYAQSVALAYKTSPSKPDEETGKLMDNVLIETFRRLLSKSQ